MLNLSCLFFYSSSLPDNFVELGDPSSISGVLNINKIEPSPAPPPPIYSTLSPERLKELFNKYRCVLLYYNTSNKAWV